MRKFFAACLIFFHVACCSLLLTGCGGSDTAAPNADAGSTGAQDAIEGAVAEGMGMPGAEMAAGSDAHGAEAPGMAMPGAEGDAGTSSPEDMAIAMGMEGSGPDSALAGAEGMDPSLMGIQGGNQPQSGRPTDVTQWTREQVLEAVKQRDPLAPAAIEAQAQLAGNDPAFAQLMADVLATASGKDPAATPAAGQTGLPAGLKPAGDGPAPKPPGGVYYRPMESLPRKLNPAMDSLEIMLGEAIIGYVPQADQATRGAAERLQQSALAGSQPGAAGATATPTDSAMAEMAGMEMGDTGGQAAGPQHDRALVEAVVRSLVKNGSDPSWQMLKGILAGSVATPLSPDEASEVVISQAFSSTTVNPLKVHQLLTDLVQNVPTDPEKSAPTYRLMAALSQTPALHYLKLQKPASAAAPQATGVGGPGMAAGMVPGMNMDAAMEGGAEMGLNGNPQAAALPTAVMTLPTVSLPEAAMGPVATILWNPANIEKLTTQLTAAPTPTDAGSALVFAANVPNDKARHAVFELFSRTYDKGAAALVATGMFSSAIGDPGMLTVLKALPRQRPRPPAAGAAPAAPTPADTWTQATQSCVLAVRDRLRKVAENAQIPNDEKPRVRLHPDGVAERNIEIISPDDVAKVLGDAAPSATSVYYTRLTVAPQRALQMQDIVDHYESRTKGFKREDRVRNLLWYDGVKKNQDGTRESMDVLVQQMTAAAADGFGGAASGAVPGAESGLGGGEATGGVPYLIEIIVVVTKDPKDAAGANSAESESDAPPAGGKQ